MVFVRVLNPLNAGGKEYTHLSQREICFLQSLLTPRPHQKLTTCCTLLPTKLWINYWCHDVESTRATPQGLPGLGHTFVTRRLTALPRYQVCTRHALYILHWAPNTFCLLESLACSPSCLLCVNFAKVSARLRLCRGRRRSLHFTLESHCMQSARPDEVRSPTTPPGANAP